MTDIMRRLNKNMNADDPDYYRIPDNRELAAQYLLLFEMSLPYGLDLNNTINVDKSASRFTVTTKNITTREVRGLDDRITAWQAANFPEVMRAPATSPTVMFSHISERNIVSMLSGTTLAIFIISAILAVALRSVRYGALSLVPNLVPAILGFGAWSLFVGSIGMSLSVVTGMTLGIVVDDTVHFLSKYIRARREKGFSAEDAVRYAFETVGPALIATTVILVVGFSILSFSSFRLNNWMAQLTAIVIAFALIADLILLPALLLLVDRKKDSTKPATAKLEHENYEADAVTA
jgi:predicted RND superfamily exporter protein